MTCRGPSRILESELLACALCLITFVSTLQLPMHSLCF